MLDIQIRRQLNFSVSRESSAFAPSEQIAGFNIHAPGKR
jgi:hypothetical protein